MTIIWLKKTSLTQKSTSKYCFCVSHGKASISLYRQICSAVVYIFNFNIQSAFIYWVQCCLMYVSYNAATITSYTQCTHIYKCYNHTVNHLHTVHFELTGKSYKSSSGKYIQSYRKLVKYTQMCQAIHYNTFIHNNTNVTSKY